MMLRAMEVVAAGCWQPPPAATVHLDYDQRRRRRTALTCASGLEFLLDLARPQLLRSGDGLRLEDGRIVAVEAAAERLLEITCADARALARIAWHLGNRHLAAEIGTGAIHIREDHVIADMARGLGAAVRPIARAFSPEGGAYAGEGAAGHGHHHTHGDDGHQSGH
jgi:urease accessory protein